MQGTHRGSRRWPHLLVDTPAHLKAHHVRGRHLRAVARDARSTGGLLLVRPRRWGPALGSVMPCTWNWIGPMQPSEYLDSRRPGPRRPAGAPSGPDQVRRAVLDAAAILFAEHGVDRVSLRDIAERANVHVGLIRRYIGTRDELVLEVFDDLSTQLAALVAENPLSGQGFGPGTVMGQWVRMASALVISGTPLTGASDFNPVQAMAGTLTHAYGLEPIAARLRAAQIVAAALGWRIFEDYLIEAGDLREVPIQTLRDELARSARRLGATPWPSPPDPTPRRR